MAPSTSRNVWLMRTALVACGFAAGLLLAEGVLRVVGVSYALPYVPDPYCGSRLRPDFSFLYMKEGRAWVHVNSDGHRDIERSRCKPPHTFRIAVLGDSFAEALQVERDATFWAIVERRLEKTCCHRPEQHVEVLNFGVSGYGTTQQLEMLRHYVWQYEPDLVLLAFLTGNDIHDNSPQLADHPIRPFYVRQDGEWVIDYSFRQNETYRHAHSRRERWKVAVINRSRLLQLLLEVRRGLQQPADVQPDASPLAKDPLYTAPQNPVWIEAWDTTEHVLRRMHQEVETKGAQFVVVTLSNAVQVDPDPNVRRDIKRRQAIEDLFYPDRRIKAVGRESGFPVITLAPRLQRYAEQHQLYLHGFENTRLGTGHWNEMGHRAAGEIIARDLCDLGL